MCVKNPAFLIKLGYFLRIGQWSAWLGRRPGPEQQHVMLFSAGSIPGLLLFYLDATQAQFSETDSITEKALSSEPVIRKNEE